MRPGTLICVAHGTRSAPGNAVAVDVARQAGLLLGVPATAAYVELCAPAFADVASATDEPAVAVPLLLSTGFHVRVDLPEAVVGTPVTVAPPLGPSPLLAAAQVDRLSEVDVARGRPVLLVAAGSQDPLALPDLHDARDLLADAWDGPVDLAALSGPLPRPADVVTPDHAVSPYLLAPGHFADRVRRECAPAVVADVIGPHPAVAALVARRCAELPVGG